VKRYGAKAVAEIVRYQRILQGVDADGFKLNNNHVSRMARRAIEDCPELATFFEMRKLSSV